MQVKVYDCADYVQFKEINPRGNIIKWIEENWGMDATYNEEGITTILDEDKFTVFLLTHSENIIYLKYL